MIVSVLLGLLGSCGGSSSSSCDASFELVLSDGSTTTLDACVDYQMDAFFEFDPDRPPEMKALHLALSATDEAGFECGVDLVMLGVCETGDYPVSPGVQLVVESFDCAGIPDDLEGSWQAVTGQLTLDTLNTGDEAGNFSGEEVVTQVAGSLEALTGDGHTISGSFDVTWPIVTGDAEESLRLEGDYEGSTTRIDEACFGGLGEGRDQDLDVTFDGGSCGQATVTWDGSEPTTVAVNAYADKFWVVADGSEEVTGSNPGGDGCQLSWTDTLAGQEDGSGGYAVTIERVYSPDPDTCELGDFESVPCSVTYDGELEPVD